MRRKRQLTEDEDGPVAMYKLIAKDDYGANVLDKDYIQKILAQSLVRESARRRKVFADRVHFLSRIVATQFQHIHFVYHKAPQSEWIQRSLNWEQQQTEHCKLLETSTIVQSWNAAAGTGEILVAYNRRLLSGQCITEITEAMEEFWRSANLKSINRTRHDRDALYHGS